MHAADVEDGCMQCDDAIKEWNQEEGERTLEEMNVTTGTQAKSRYPRGQVQSRYRDFHFCHVAHHPPLATYGGHTLTLNAHTRAATGCTRQWIEYPWPLP